jgi:predicted glycogen debranching enzyme
LIAISGDAMDAGARKTREEWLLVDHRGAFAMGLPDGTRDRKYHGFLMGISGRDELSGLTDFELFADEEPLWPHRYAQGAGSQAEVVSPPIPASWSGFRENPYPCWRWELPGGTLEVRLEPAIPSGVRFVFVWDGSHSLAVKFRPFLGMRNLHQLGGTEWTCSEDISSGIWKALSASGAALFCKPYGNWQWASAPVWHERFVYSEERERGYEFMERLYSAGEFKVSLELNRRAELHWSFKGSFKETSRDDSSDQRETQARPKLTRPTPRVFDFVVNDPPGIVAGFPWFGEWGRDTFISLPGIVAASLASPEENAAEEIWDWSMALLERWGAWIEKEGMLPNLIGENGVPQWDAADATLWWIHSLASLWQISLTEQKEGTRLRRRFAPLLANAILAINEGRHRHLTRVDTGLLQVNTSHSTWMDAQVHGRAVTPRTGALPEINALWFQARCLHQLWSEDLREEGLERFADLVLQIQEPGRPNRVFLHSLPLAPSFVASVAFGARKVAASSLDADIKWIEQELWTPVGLRSLSSEQRGFRPRCEGTQEERDLAYHQGTVWAWLGGHFEMAKARQNSNSASIALRPRSSIEGHFAEIFDATEPHAFRGAPAQAWSLACLEEAAFRRRMKLDQRLARLLSRQSPDKGLTA